MRVKKTLSLIALALSLSGSSFARGQQPKPDPAATAKPAEATNEITHYPLDTVVNKDGDAFVVDRNLPGLWRRKGEEIEVFVRGSKRFREPLNAARCVAIDKDGKLLVGDSSTREIYRIDDDNKPQPLTGGAIGIPMDIAVRADGTLMVADVETRTLLRVSADGKEVKPVAQVNPRGVFVDSQDRVWVVSQDAQQLQIVDDNGKSKVIVDKRVFEFPHQVVVTSKGQAFVSDGYKKAIWRVAEGSAPEVVVSGAPLDNPVGLSLVDDQVVITDPRARQVFRLKDNKCEPWFEIPAK